MTLPVASRHQYAAEPSAKHCIVVTFCSTHSIGHHAMTGARESSANPQARRELAKFYRAGSRQIGHLRDGQHL